MLVSVFRKIQWHTPLLLLLIGGVFWLTGFLDPVCHADLMAADNAPFFRWLSPLIVRFPIASLIIALLLLFGQSFLINHIAAENSFTDRFSALPALIYLLLMSSSPGLISLHPVLLANTFLLLAMNKMFDVYKEHQVMLEVYNVGLLIAVASLFYYPAFMFLLLLLFSLLVYYLFSLRALMAAMIGVFTPFLFLGVYYYLTDTLAVRMEAINLFVWPPPLFSQTMGVYQQAFAIGLGVIVLFSFLRLWLVFFPEQPIRMRKRVRVLFFFLLTALLSYLLAGDYLHIHHGLMMLPLSLSLAVFFSGMRQKKLAEGLFLLLFILVVISRFHVN